MMRKALEISSPAMVYIAKIASSITRPLVFLLVRLLSPECLASAILSCLCFGVGYQKGG